MVEQSPMLEVNQCPSWAAALGYMGVAVAVCLSNWGAAVSHATGTNVIQIHPALGEGTQPTIGSDLDLDRGVSVISSDDRIRWDIDHDVSPSELNRRSDRVSISIRMSLSPH
jgi:hypothetical protein